MVQTTNAVRIDYQRGAGEFCSDLKCIIDDIFSGDWTVSLLEGKSLPSVRFERNIDILHPCLIRGIIELKGPYEWVTLRTWKNEEGMTAYAIDIRVTSASALLQMLPELRRPSTSSAYNNHVESSGNRKYLGIELLFGGCSITDESRSWSYQFNYQEDELGEVNLEILKLWIDEFIAREAGVNYSSETQEKFRC